MGVDVYGKCPASKAGEHLSYNWTGWRMVAGAALDLCPEEITARCRYWGSNDGDGLDADGARALAQALEEKIANGEVARHIQIQELKEPTPANCKLCSSSGRFRRRDGVLIACPVCDGTGRNEFSLESCVERVREFATFLHDSGGFEIW